MRVRMELAEFYLQENEDDQRLRMVYYVLKLNVRTIEEKWN